MSNSPQRTTNSFSDESPEQAGMDPRTSTNNAVRSSTPHANSGDETTVESQAPRAAGSSSASNSARSTFAYSNGARAREIGNAAIVTANTANSSSSSENSFDRDILPLFDPNFEEYATATVPEDSAAVLIGREPFLRARKSAIEKLPLAVATVSDKDICCVICLGELEEGEEIRILPCSHKFHKSCIDSKFQLFRLWFVPLTNILFVILVYAEWLCYNGCCPIDMKRIGTPPHQSRSQASSSGHAVSN